MPTAIDDATLNLMKQASNAALQILILNPATDPDTTEPGPGTMAAQARVQTQAAATQSALPVGPIFMAAPPAPAAERPNDPNDPPPHDVAAEVEQK